MNAVEMRVSTVQTPPPIEWNKAEINSWLDSILSQYANLVYTDAQITEAKADRAKLNKIRKAINDERLRYQREYMAPLDAFKAEVDELLKRIDSVNAQIGAQITEAENKRREEKADAISEYWNGIEAKPDWLDLGNVYNDKWLNASYSLKAVKDDINDILKRIYADIAAINSLSEYKFEAMEVYKRTLNLMEAIEETKRRAEMDRLKREWEERLKAEAEAKRTEPDVEIRKVEDMARREAAKADEIQREEFREWIGIEIYATYDEALRLRKYLEDNRISFRPL